MNPNCILKIHYPKTQDFKKRINVNFVSLISVNCKERGLIYIRIVYNRIFMNQRRITDYWWERDMTNIFSRLKILCFLCKFLKISTLLQITLICKFLQKHYEVLEKTISIGSLLLLRPLILLKLNLILINLTLVKPNCSPQLSL